MSGRKAVVAMRCAAAMLALTAPLTTLSAQDQPVDADEAITNTKQMYGPPPSRQNCQKPEETLSESEIVVCAKPQDDSQFRVKSSRELDPESQEALKDGVPRAPDVAGGGIIQGPATVSGLCLPSCPPPPVYIVDFNLLPTAPEGSDADKIAKGEKKAN